MKPVQYIYNLDKKVLSKAQFWHNDDLYFACETQNVDIKDLLIKLKWTNYKAESSRLMQQGAIELNGVKINSVFCKYTVEGLHNNYIELRYPKKFKFASIQLVQNNHTKLDYLLFKLKYKIIAFFERIPL